MPCMRQSINILIYPKNTKENHRQLKMSIDRTKYMSLSEVKQLRDYAQGKGGKVWMLVDMALSTGLRVSEMVLIQVEDIDFDRGFIMVTRLKKKKPVYEPLAISQELIDHIREYCNGQAGALFVGERGPLTSRGLQQIWKNAVKRAGLSPELSIHSARHTIAVHLLKKTGNLRQVQKQLGHSSPATTANMYADVTFEDMQNGVNGLYR